MRARAALLSATLLVAAFLGGCGTRDRANPFDPANQHTGGAPTGFAALARDAQVDLVWQTPGTPGLTGFEVWRRTAAETTFHQITGVLAPNVTSLVDRGLLNGLDHHYRLYYVLSNGAVSNPAEDVATPGPQTPWVVDGSGVLDEITADGRHVAVAHGGFFSPTVVAADDVARHVWVSDPDAGEVSVLDVLAGVTVAIPVSATPGAIGVSPTDSTAWVCREDGNEVAHLSPDGRTLTPLTGFTLPLSVAVSGFDGTIWVCDRDGNRVRHFSPDTGALPDIGVPAPSRVAIDPATGIAWVSSFTQATVWKIAANGASSTGFTGFAGPVGIAFDPTHGSVWVADALGDRVRVLATDGTTRFTVTNIPGARSVTLDPVTGEAWVLASTSGELVRIATDGTIVRRLGGFPSPNDVALLR